MRNGRGSPINSYETEPIYEQDSNEETFSNAYPSGRHLSGSQDEGRWDQSMPNRRYSNVQNGRSN